MPVLLAGAVPAEGKGFTWKGVLLWQHSPAPGAAGGPLMLEQLWNATAMKPAGLFDGHADRGKRRAKAAACLQACRWA